MRWALLAAVTAVAGCADVAPPTSASVRQQRRRNLFDYRHIPSPLEHHRDGDVVLLTACVSFEGGIEHFGHQGRIAYPTTGHVGEIGSIVRGRFTVTQRDGEKCLTLAEALGRLSTTELRAHAAADYNRLLPEIRRAGALAESKLTLGEIAPDYDGLSVVCPPEDWHTLYVAVRQVDKMYAWDTALVYNCSVGRYTLLDCSTAHYWKGE